MIISGGGDWFTHELVLLSAPDDAALVVAARQIKAFLDQTPHASVAALAYTCAKRFQPGGAVLAFVVSSAEDLRERLATAAERIAGGAARIRDRSGSYYFRRDASVPPPKMAFVFPGALSFYPDMMRDIALLFPVCRAPFDLLEEAMTGEARFAPSSFIFPPATCYRHDADIFAAGGYAEATISVISACFAMLRLFETAGLRPDAVTGLSGGDLAALACAGCMRFKDRSKRMDFLRDTYTLAGRIVRGMPALEGRQTVLDRDWCLRFRSDIRSFAKRWMKTEPQCPVYSPATAAPLPESFRKARDGAAEIWYAESRIAETAERMYADGIRIFVEAGPRSLMSTAFKEALRGKPDAEILSANRAHRSGLVQLQHTLAVLAARGRVFDPVAFFAGRSIREIDFAAPLSLEVKATRCTLKREFPHFNLPADASGFGRAQVVSAGAAAPGARAKGRAAAQAARERRQRQFDFGASQPLVSDADILARNGGESIALVKTFTLEDVPLFADAAFGTSRLAYSDPHLHGYTPLSLFAACEIMAETAARLVSGMRLVEVRDLQYGRRLAFDEGKLRLVVRAERVPAADASTACARVSFIEDEPDGAARADACMGTFVFAAKPTPRPAFVPAPLDKPRNVHWTEREIYPDRLFSGERLRCIRSADCWSEGGLDYEVEMPSSADAVSHTRFPVWEANPQLLSAIAEGFRLWRSHERFPGAFSVAFRLRRLSLHENTVPPGGRLRCYLRLTDVTPRSQVVGISVSDGNGQLVFGLEGYEELSEHVPEEYVGLVRAPAGGYLTHALAPDVMGAPAAAFATAWTASIPYAIFERNDEIWLKTVSQIVLGVPERRLFAEMPGTARRRTEWLFGRIAAKEAVRRFLLENYQARWSDADIQIWADEMGKPHALGKWSDNLAVNLDIAISHTADFVVAVAAANARVGVDAEAANRDLTEEFVKGVFVTSELELAAASGVQDATIRFWCAKEAVSKALGTGIRYSPRDLTVVSFRPEDGVLDVTLGGEWLDAFKAFRGRRIPVRTARVRDHAVASCFVPGALFA